MASIFVYGYLRKEESGCITVNCKVCTCFKTHNHVANFDHVFEPKMETDICNEMGENDKVSHRYISFNCQIKLYQMNTRLNNPHPTTKQLLLNFCFVSFVFQSKTFRGDIQYKIDWHFERNTFLPPTPQKTAQQSQHYNSFIVFRQAAITSLTLLLLT